MCIKGNQPILERSSSSYGIYWKSTSRHSAQGLPFHLASVEFQTLFILIHQLSARLSKELQAYIVDMAKEAGTTEPESLGQQIIMLFEGTSLVERLSPGSRLLHGWVSMMAVAVSPEARVRMRNAYANDVGMLPSGQIASIIEAADLNLQFSFPSQVDSCVVVKEP